MNSITLTETFPHPKEKVFAAFAKADTLVRWIAPADNIPTTINTFNFVPEGKYEIVFEVSGKSQVLSGQFLLIQPHDKLSFTWEWQYPAPHANVESLVEISFKKNGTYTKLILVHSGLDAPGMSTRHHDGWKGCLPRLHQNLQEIKP